MIASAKVTAPPDEIVQDDERAGSDERQRAVRPERENGHVSMPQASFAAFQIIIVATIIWE
jgi:hypothetical protein